MAQEKVRAVIALDGNDSPVITSSALPPQIAYTQALRFWLRLGCISFGGPAGQIAIMHRELVEQRRWISEARFLHALNYCMLLPGPEAQQLATYIGWLLHRTWGGIAAGALFVLPSLFILIALSWVYVVFGNQPLVAGFFWGIKPAVAALVLQAVQRVGSRSLGKPQQRPLLWAIAVLSFVGIYFLKLPFPALVAGAALIGWLGARWLPGQFGGGAGHGAASPGKSYGPALIDDHTPTPEHALFKPARLARVLAAGAALWLAPMLALLALRGWHDTLTQMAWFFTKAALLTFGGAYAVLPYVVQGAVEQFGWLSAAQMIDGLALGETTPGPLIMVVAFVGFLGGWGQQVLGPEHLFWGAALAACVVTWFTFLPSFIFILAGGPLVEAAHGKLQLTAPLQAITAAVVGVIASLALFFIAHIAHKSGATGSWFMQTDFLALALAASVLLALVHYKMGVVKVIVLSGVVGLLIKLTDY